MTRTERAGLASVFNEIAPALPACLLSWNLPISPGGHRGGEARREEPRAHGGATGSSFFHRSQKPVETHMNLEEQTDEMPGSELNQKFVEMCLDTAVETDINPEKQADPDARLEVTQKPVETCQDTVVEADANLEKQADLEARLEVNEEPVETCQDKVVEADVNPEKLAANPGVIYRCKRCRRMVATQEYVVTRKVGLGERCFLRRKSYHVDDKEPKCTCIFVEPMKWMQAGQWKRDTFQTSSGAWGAKHDWDRSIGQACSAAAEPG